MGMQTTFVMVKPDGVQRGLVGNIIHGSDGEDTAAFELGLWFPEGVIEWTRDAESQIYE